MERLANPKPLYPFPNAHAAALNVVLLLFNRVYDTYSKLRQHGARLPRSRRPLADGRRRRRAHCHHMFNLDGAHTLQAELRSLHRKPRGYVEEGADAEDLLAVEAQVQPKPARQTSLTGFFGAPLKPAASLLIAAATASY